MLRVDVGLYVGCRDHIVATITVLIEDPCPLGLPEILAVVPC